MPTLQNAKYGAKKQYNQPFFSGRSGGYTPPPDPPAYWSDQGPAFMILTQAKGAVQYATGHAMPACSISCGYRLLMYVKWM